MWIDLRGNGRWRLVVLVITALALFWRLPGLFANGFQADEALFASFARTIAVWRDPLLVLQPVDKPPLLFYAQAAFYPMFGPVQWAARLPDFIASILLIPLTARLVWRWYGDGLAAVMTAVLLAFSPLAIQFSPTA
ncbi:MAG: glycosyltransferase family 39 protein, partial [Anaerolineae bacterium]